MGAIGFQTKDKAVYVRGSERAYAGILLAELTKAILRPQSNRDLLLSAIPSSHYLATSQENNIIWADRFRVALEFDGLELTVDDKKIGYFDLFLNTALAVGSDALKMLASIHGQCEVNAFIRGKNRAWMADIIENDMAGLFRPGKGWDEVIEFLRESEDETVFMSYSVTGDILGNVFSEWLKNVMKEKGLDADEEDNYGVYQDLSDEWESFDTDKQWEHVDAWVEERSTQGFELSPERWAEKFSFGDGLNAGKIIEFLQVAQENISS